MIYSHNNWYIKQGQARYYENLEFNGRNFTLTSRDPKDPCVIDNTVINGNRNGSVVTFNYNEKTSCVLSGFTITNGLGGQGGGISCISASPTITDCSITNNLSDDGGGIYCHSASPRVMNCIVRYNSTKDNIHTVGGPGTTIHWDGGNGGGIYCSSSSNPTISYCDISWNQTGDGTGGSHVGGSGGRGGGLCLDSASSATVLNCTIGNNSTGIAIYGGGFGQGIGGHGGGIYCAGSSPTITNCLVIKNSTGGGDGYGGSGGGIYVIQGNPIITNSTISGNRTGWGQIYGHGYGKGGGIYCGADTNPVITNSVFWIDSPEEVFAEESAEPNVNYSDVQGSWPGTYNISADPCFADSNNDDYHLKSFYGRRDPSCQAWLYDDVNSPCIDAGNPSSDWTEEFWPHGKRINMGAYGGTPEASMSPSNIGNVANLDCDNITNFVDYALFVKDWYGGNSYTIPRGQATVDGDLSDWAGNVEWIELDKVYSGDPCDILQSRFALQWNSDTDKIYVAVIVEDINHVLLDDYNDWNASDRLELYSQGDAAGGDYTSLQEVAQQYYIAPNTNGGGWATLGFGEPNISSTDLEYAVKVSGDFIIYEAGVKQFDNYGGLSGGQIITTELDVNDIVRFDVAADTRWSDVGFGMLSENLMIRKYRIADNIAQYKLVEVCNVPHCLDLKGDFDRNCILNWWDLIIFCDNWLEQEQPE